MERLTEQHAKKQDGYYMRCSEMCNKQNCDSCHNLDNVVDRLGKIEDILGDDYDLEKLRELLEAKRDGRCVVFKFGMGSTIYRTWVRPDGSCPFVSVQLIDTVEGLVNAERWSNAYATREAAEQALRGISKNGT